MEQAKSAPGVVPADITLPRRPPARFARLFHNWTREGYILAVMAVTGWSMRLAVAEVAGRKFGVSAGAGSLKRLFARLAENGLLEERVVEVLPGGKATFVNLTPGGEEVMRACRIEPVESEWARLMRLHGGQEKHAALVCAFTYHARQFGYTTEVCPEAEGPFVPDVLLERDGESICVEVEAESGEPERRMKKWRNQMEAQGFAALCAPTPEVRHRLVAEAKAGAKHGKATDIRSLIQGTAGLWVEEW